jgi:hypothetical protein
MGLTNGGEQNKMSYLKRDQPLWLCLDCKIISEEPSFSQVKDRAPIDAGLKRLGTIFSDFDEKTGMGVEFSYPGENEACDCCKLKGGVYRYRFLPWNPGWSPLLAKLSKPG